MLFIDEYVESFSCYYVLFLHKLHILKPTTEQLCDLFLGGTFLLPNLLQFKILRLYATDYTKYLSHTFAFLTIILHLCNIRWTRGDISDLPDVFKAQRPSTHHC